MLTILAVEDVERSARFYRGVFGWPARVDVPVYVEFELAGGAGLGVYQREAFAQNPGQEPAVTPAGAISATEIYLQQENLDACIAKLEAHGAKKLSERAPRPWGDEAAYYADPDGNVVVVAAPLSGADGGENESS
ncbi:MAG: VOC family protein [Deltaproteobacteria bacterium]|nr:VOC family protein [Deltaproteobacteria bacterium]